MKCYKLTDQYNKTKNDLQWGPNVTHKATGNSKRLCSDGWIHFYADPIIAILMYPIHVNFEEPNLWEAETSGEILLEPLKGGTKILTTIKQIQISNITTNQRVAFGILCALKVWNEQSFVNWANNWLNGKNRNANAAANAAAAAANAAAYAAAYAAANAANAAAAAYTAAAYTAANAYAAADAADAININFSEIAKQAMNY